MEVLLDKSTDHIPPPLIRRKRRRSGGALLASVDAGLILVGFVIAYWMRYIVNWPSPINRVVLEVATANFVDLAAFLPITLLLVIVVMAQFAMKGLYRLPRSAGFLDHASIIVSSTITGIALLVLVVFVYKPFFYSRLIFAFAWFSINILLCLWRGSIVMVRR